jgi:hypothetical protein
MKLTIALFFTLSSILFGQQLTEGPLTPIPATQVTTLANARATFAAVIKTGNKAQIDAAGKAYLTVVRSVLGNDVIGTCTNGSRTVNRIRTHDYKTIVHATGTEKCSVAVVASPKK